MKPIVYKSDVAFSDEAYAVLDANAKRYPLGTIVQFTDGRSIKRVRPWLVDHWMMHSRKRTIYVCPNCEKEIRDLADSGDDPNACAECGKLFVQPMERKV